MTTKDTVDAHARAGRQAPIRAAVEYDCGMRYAQRGGYTPAEQQRREQVRLGIWAHLKRSWPTSPGPASEQLTTLVKTRLRRMQYRPGLIDGFLGKTGLDLSNFHN